MSRCSYWRMQILMKDNSLAISCLVYNAECGGIIGGSSGAVARGAGLVSRKRNSTPCSILRSEEIMPAYQRFDNKQAGSAASDTAGSLNSISSSEGSS